MPRCPRCHRRLAPGARCPRDGQTGPAGPLRQVPAPPALDGIALGALLGAGGFAAVWSGRMAGREVAVKVALAATLAARSRFEREAAALAAVGAPAVPALIEHRVADGRPVLILERLDGRELAGFLAERPEPEPGGALAIARSLVEVLGAVHARDVVHRDLKPENIWLESAGPDGRIRLLDFGLTPTGPGGGFRTRAGVVVGTPEYMAPEQLRGQAVDHRADLYGLGVVLHELFTGAPPFGGTPAEIEYGHLMRRAPLAAGAPAAVAEVIAACLSKDPAGRPALDAVAAALARPDRPIAPAGASAADEPLPRRSLVLLAARGIGMVPVADAAGARGGFPIGLARGHLIVGFDGRGGDPVEAARAQAAEVARAGGRACLHVAPVALWSRRDGPPLVTGAAVESGDWIATAAASITWTEAFAAAVPEPPAQPPPLVGRDGLLSALAATIDRIGDGGPMLVAVTGEPGAGRSRLAAALRELAAGRGLAVVDAAAGTGAATADPIALGDAWRDRAAAGPIAIVIDDADRIDPALRAAVEYAALEDAGPIWIALVGGSGVAGAGARAARRERFELPPLAGVEARKLAAAFLRADYVAEDALDRLVRATGGLPRLMQEAAAALEHAGALVGDPDGSRRLDVAALETLPEQPGAGWRASFAVRELPADLLELAELCALLGSFDPAQLEAVQRGLERAGHPAPALDAAVGCFQLARRGLLRERDGRYRFAAEAVREAIAARVGTSAATAVHRAALGFWAGSARVDPGALEARARHAAAIGDRDQAAQLRLTLGYDALRTHAAATAEAQFGLALELATDPAGRASARCGRGAARYRIDRAAEAAADLREAEKLAAGIGDLRLQITALLELATALDWAHELEASAAAAERAAALAQFSAGRPAERAGGAGQFSAGRPAERAGGAGQFSAGRPAERAGGAGQFSAGRPAERAGGAGQFSAGRPAERAGGAGQFSAGRPAERAGGAGPDPWLDVRVTVARGRSAWRAGRLAEAIELLGAGAAGAAVIDDYESRVIALLLLGPALARAGRTAESEDTFAEVIALCERARDRLHLCAAYGNRMFLWSARKQPERARDDLRRACELARQVGHPGPERVATYNLAEDLYWAGDEGEALVLARRARWLQERFVGPAAEDPLLLARVLTARGEHEAAAAELAWIEDHVPPGARSPTVQALMAMLRLVHGEDGDWDRLAEHRDELGGDDWLEILYWRARVGPGGAAARAEAAPLLAGFPIWRRRFAELG